jgi:site-specific recombinase XerC
MPWPKSHPSSNGSRTSRTSAPALPISSTSKTSWGFIGIEHPEDFRIVTRAYVIEWRDDFKRRALSPATVCRKLSALSSLYQYLCEHNAVPLNPVKGVQRPKANNNEGTTPAFSDEQACELLKVPPENTLGSCVITVRTVLLWVHD